ncbi:Menaquinone biosynthesis methyltransferase [Tritrichomonas foetus]|uniref:Menaquinone biosynthesis methyltransferase n=1 Tax=Tritrichomonas foetus TaxID=1144522 RepID=A0A1J4KT53_9EUKA|nr:Menaquinone biosynthesis methyltransferase [Tritrichomonas foetus]|eukprot:OHT14298.1 Menaquinone biosynthesis methyltransferase [Tritrichomonas foetus]
MSEEEEETPEFHLLEYWEERYEKDTKPYEWFISWPEIKNIIHFNFEHYERALNFGCGNSSLSLDIQDYFNEVHNIDISTVVINQMKEKFIDNKKQFWYQMDCLELKFPNNYFDFTFDKGTFDAINCGDELKMHGIKSLLEIFRVLKVGGYLIEITCGLFTPINSTQFDGKVFHWRLIEKGKLRNPTNSQQNIYFYIYQKTSDAFDENGVDDDQFLKIMDDDMLLQLCEEDLNE